MCGESGGVVFEKSSEKEREKENTAYVSENDILI